MTPPDKDIEKLAALGRMTRGLIHDFNNSLASIMGYAEFLVTDLPPDSEQYLFANNIRQAGIQMQDLIEQIRALAIEKGQGKDITLNLSEDIKQIVDRFAIDIPPYQNIIFKSECNEAILSIPAHQSRTLFSNLIKNALESMVNDGGDVTVRISETTSVTAEKGDYEFMLTLLTAEKTDAPLVKIDIIDTGCGMDEIILGLASEPHFTTKPVGAAHGMGLPTAYGIINYLEGGLSIATTPERGTCVSVIIPVDDILSSRNGDTEIGTISPRTILLVEDRDMLRHTIETMLKRDGHAVTSLSEGLQALDLLREDPKAFDILMTDFNMPFLNGKDLINEVREDFPKLPVIVISGDNEHLKSVQNDPSNKNVFILQKPISQRNLKTTIDKAIQGN